MDGGSVFYAYNAPFSSSSNTGFEQQDSDLLYFVADDAGQVSFVLVHDKANDGSGGQVNVAIQATSNSLKNKNIQLLTRDDPGYYGSKAQCVANTNSGDC